MVQESHAEAVKGADSDPRGCLLAESICDAFFQLLRRFVAERQREQTFWLSPAFVKQVLDASDQRRGLTSSRAGADQRGRASERRGGELAVVVLAAREPFLSRSAGLFGRNPEEGLRQLRMDSVNRDAEVA